ncbi:hypothetical protein DSCW_60100 [Desulfosarcina widdelii]|uniref:PAC domain-containing protein n=1 Tax=Desulfosarcina widdelii TaxID=947919 RepID=A0A5K7ZFV0_9BACT|nr:PAS domain-containing protein [Desulfosarcina widdelii]BBO78593.1 hypothetical protein DSCW_60100 [Desulfosarcina widdelii]
MSEKKRSISDGNLLQSLKKSYALLNGILESSKDVVIFALDRQYRYLAFNRIHYQTMKRIWGVDIAIGNSMLEYINNPEDRVKAKNNFDRTLSGESFVLLEEYGDESVSRRYYLDHYNPTLNEDGEIIGINLFLIDITEQKRLEIEREKIIKELQNAMSEIKTLRGFIPICANCKNIRDDKGYWQKIEKYIEDRSDAQFSHSLCPKCIKELYPDMKITSDI